MSDDRFRVDILVCLSIWTALVETAVIMTVRMAVFSDEGVSFLRTVLIAVALMAVLISLYIILSFVIYRFIRLLVPLLASGSVRLVTPVGIAIPLAFMMVFGAIDGPLPSIIVFLFLVSFLTVLIDHLLHSTSRGAPRVILAILSIIIVPAMLFGSALIGVLGGETTRLLSRVAMFATIRSTLLAGAILVVPLSLFFSGTWFRNSVSSTPIPKRITVMVMVPIGVTGLAIGVYYLVPLGGTPQQDDRNIPSIACILIDTLRRDATGCYGNPDARTAYIDLIARRGITFANATTPIPKTQQSIASLFTGQLPTTNGVRELFSPLPDHCLTIAEITRQKGFSRSALVHNAWLLRGMGLEQGFDAYHDWLTLEREKTLGVFGETRIGQFIHRIVHGRDDDIFQTDARVCIDRAIAELRKFRKKPFFLYVHLFDPHWPYAAPHPWQSMFHRGYQGPFTVNDRVPQTGTRGDMIFNNTMSREVVSHARAMYDGEVAYSDHQTGRLIDELERWSREHGRPVHIVFLSDHGESFGEHDYFFHHGEFTYETCLEIPLLITRFPLENPRDTVIGDAVSIIDLMPEICRLIEHNPPEAIDGRPLPLPANTLTTSTQNIQNREDDATMNAHHPPRSLYAESDISLFRENARHYLPGIAGKWRSVSQDQWKLIAIPRKDSVDYQLYNLAEDPGELLDCHQQFPEIVSTLREALETWWQPGTEQRDVPVIGDDEIDRLKSLGYIN